MGHFYGYKGGDVLTIVSGRYQGCTGVVDRALTDSHVAVDTRPVVTVRWERWRRVTIIHALPKGLLGLLGTLACLDPAAFCGQADSNLFGACQDSVVVLRLLHL